MADLAFSTLRGSGVLPLEARLVMPAVSLNKDQVDDAITASSA
jgi:hypothetical protein